MSARTRAITDRQAEVLEYLIEQLPTLQRLPTCAEITSFLGATSRTNGLLYLRRLELHGYLVRDRGPGVTDRVRVIRDATGQRVRVRVEHEGQVEQLAAAWARLRSHVEQRHAPSCDVEQLAIARATAIALRLDPGPRRSALDHEPACTCGIRELLDSVERLLPTPFPPEPA